MVAPTELAIFIEGKQASLLPMQTGSWTVESCLLCEQSWVKVKVCFWRVWLKPVQFYIPHRMSSPTPTTLYIPVRWILASFLTHSQPCYLTHNSLIQSHTDKEDEEIHNSSSHQLHILTGKLNSLYIDYYFSPDVAVCKCNLVYSFIYKLFCEIYMALLYVTPKSSIPTVSIT